MPKTKGKSQTKKASSSSSSFLEEHKNLKWLIPLLILVLLGGIFMVRHKFSADELSEQDHSIKDAVREKLNMSNDVETKDDVNPTMGKGNNKISPYPTSSTNY